MTELFAGQSSASLSEPWGVTNTSSPVFDQSIGATWKSVAEKNEYSQTWVNERYPITNSDHLPSVSTQFRCPNFCFFSPQDYLWTTTAQIWGPEGGRCTEVCQCTCLWLFKISDLYALRCCKQKTFIFLRLVTCLSKKCGEQQIFSCNQTCLPVKNSSILWFKKKYKYMGHLKCDYNKLAALNRISIKILLFPFLNVLSTFFSCSYGLDLSSP